MDIGTAEWIRCPVYGGKTRDKMRKDTILQNFPLFCPKCKHENLINVKNLQIVIITVPAAKPQSR